MTSLVPSADFVPATINVAAVAPLLIVTVAALLGVLVEAFVPRDKRYVVQLTIAVLGLLGALAAVLTGARTNQTTTVAGAIVIDGPALLVQGSLCVLALIGLLAMSERLGSDHMDAFTRDGASAPGSHAEGLAQRLGATTTEIYPLTMFSVLGMLIFPAAGDLLTLFVALEVLSLPLYVLTGLARRRRLLSQEASLKYFLLGAFSSAFYLFGAALLYGYAGSVRLHDIATAIGTVNGLDGLLLPGVFFVLIGLLFKIGAVPFHAWTPDVYQGAPTAVSGFMAACTKLAAMAALLRVLYVGVAGDRWSFQVALWIVAVLTMVVGSIVTIAQSDIKRMLAYSSIAHAGFILVAVLSFDRAGVASALFYAIAYGFSVIAAFTIVALLRDADGSEATAISQWAGLGRRAPVVAALFTLLMLAFAGIPLTSGFTSKFGVFNAAIAHGGTMGIWLAVIGVLCSAITAWAYFRVILVMYFAEPAPQDAAGAARVVLPSAASTIAIATGVAMTVILGVVPARLLELATQNSQFLP